MNNKNRNVKLSIILVCLNNYADVLKTIKSLNKLSYSNKEIIIIDSSDNDKIFKFVKTNDKFKYIYKWEKKNGVYSAMNLGIDTSSTGSYVWFLNPGDTLVDGRVVTEIMEKLENSPANWSIAQARNAAPNEDQVYPKKIDILDKNRVANGKVKISHQAIFVLRETLISNGYFKTSYRIAADQDMLMALVKHKPLFIPKIIVEIDQTGLSSIHPIRTIYETIRVNYESRVWNSGKSFVVFLVKILTLFFGTIKLNLVKLIKEIQSSL